MYRLVVLLNTTIFLLVLYLPLLSPIASNAANTGSGTRFGTNLSTPEYGTDGMYSDIFMLADFRPISSTNSGLNSDGYPTQVGYTYTIGMVVSGGYPPGAYQFYGEGKFTMGGYYKIANLKTTINPSSGKTITTCTITFNFPAYLPDNYTGAGSWLVPLWGVTPTDANDLPSNFHLMRPDVPAWFDGYYNTYSMFGPQFLQAITGQVPPKQLPSAAEQEKIKPVFCCLRFMNWVLNQPTYVTGPYNAPGTSANYGVTTWASRPSPTYFSPVARGICYENMIEMCNETNSDLWISIPLYAIGPTPTDWCANMATLIKQKLHPNLHVYYEIEDELWNWANPYWVDWAQVDTWCSENSNLAFLGPAGPLTPVSGKGAGWTRHGGEMGVLIMNAAQIMQPILGSMGRPVLAGQFNDTTYCSGGLQYIARYFGPRLTIFGQYLEQHISVLPLFLRADQSLQPYKLQSLNLLYLILITT